ncbi:hypothetical protein NL676_037725 [Syzygium grande]|nr:hypothetical protein NL676_037725 [Syzygium grande]
MRCPHPPPPPPPANHQSIPDVPRSSSSSVPVTLAVCNIAQNGGITCSWSSSSSLPKPSMEELTPAPSFAMEVNIAPALRLDSREVEAKGDEGSSMARLEA